VNSTENNPSNNNSSMTKKAYQHRLKIGRGSVRETVGSDAVASRPTSSPSLAEEQEVFTTSAGAIDNANTSFDIENVSKKRSFEQTLDNTMSSDISMLTNDIDNGTGQSRSKGRRGDPRMHKAVEARIEQPHLSLLQALKLGGFNFPDNVKERMPSKDGPIHDDDGVLLSQRKNQLSRRLRIHTRKQLEAERLVKMQMQEERLATVQHALSSAAASQSNIQSLLSANANQMQPLVNFNGERVTSARPHVPSLDYNQQSYSNNNNGYAGTNPQMSHQLVHLLNLQAQQRNTVSNPNSSVEDRLKQLLLEQVLQRNLQAQQQSNGNIMAAVLASVAQSNTSYPRQNIDRGVLLYQQMQQDAIANRILATAGLSPPNGTNNTMFH